LKAIDAEWPQAAAPKPPVHAFAYLPDNRRRVGDEMDPGAAGPTAFDFWHGVARDSAGTVILAHPSPINMSFNVSGTEPQPVVFGVARGPFEKIAEGPISMTGLEEGRPKTVASGHWGKIEAKRLKLPDAWTKPPATHSLRLVSPVFPPKTERRVLFFDSKGRQVASCSDGPNNAASFGWPNLLGSNPVDVVRFQVEERPYEFVKFDDVKFAAPRIEGHKGAQGREYAVKAPAGTVVGVLASTQEGPWNGSVLYAPDGTRWIDPDGGLDAYEYGQFDPWNHQQWANWNVLLEPNAQSASQAPSSCEVYAADSPNGPRQELLTLGSASLTFRSPMTYILCKPTKRPYLRIEMKAGDGDWKTLHTVTVTEQMLHAAETAPLGTRILEVFYDDNGGVRVWRDESLPVKLQKTWRPGEQRIRTLARLRDGSVVEASTNMSGLGGTGVGYLGLEYTRQASGVAIMLDGKSVDIRDVGAFEIQTQNFLPASATYVHSPQSQ
jgi:hypothetical protein